MQFVFAYESDQVIIIKQCYIMCFWINDITNDIYFYYFDNFISKLIKLMPG